MKKAESRIDSVEHDAIGMGFSPVKDRKGRRIGIGQLIPSATEVIKMALDEEALYRLLSAIAHGHSWALQQLSFRLTDAKPSVSADGVKIFTMEKGIIPTGIAYLIFKAAKAFARPVWYQCTYYGWNQKEMRNILESTFDELGAKPHVRFWRTS